MLNWESEEITDDAEAEEITSAPPEQRKQSCPLGDPDCEACQ